MPIKIFLKKKIQAIHSFDICLHVIFLNVSPSIKFQNSIAQINWGDLLLQTCHKPPQLPTFHYAVLLFPQLQNINDFKSGCASE